MGYVSPHHFFASVLVTVTFSGIQISKDTFSYITFIGCIIIFSILETLSPNSFLEGHNKAGRVQSLITILLQNVSSNFGLDLLLFADRLLLSAMVSR